MRQSRCSPKPSSRLTDAPRHRLAEHPRPTYPHTTLAPEQPPTPSRRPPRPHTHSTHGTEYGLRARGAGAGLVVGAGLRAGVPSPLAVPVGLRGAAVALRAGAEALGMARAPMSARGGGEAQRHGGRGVLWDQYALGRGWGRGVVGGSSSVGGRCSTVRGWYYHFGITIREVLP